MALICPHCGWDGTGVGREPADADIGKLAVCNYCCSASRYTKEGMVPVDADVVYSRDWQHISSRQRLLMASDWWHGDRIARSNIDIGLHDKGDTEEEQVATSSIKVETSMEVLSPSESKVIPAEEKGKKGFVLQFKEGSYQFGEDDYLEVVHSISRKYLQSCGKELDPGAKLIGALCKLLAGVKKFPKEGLYEAMCETTMYGIQKAMEVFEDVLRDAVGGNKDG